MSTNNYQIVKELDTRYAIALGFCADGDPDDVYDNVEDARSQNEGRTPSVGFVVILLSSLKNFSLLSLAFECYANKLESIKFEQKRIRSQMAPDSLFLLFESLPNAHQNHKMRGVHPPWVLSSSTGRLANGRISQCRLLPTMRVLCSATTNTWSSRCRGTCFPSAFALLPVALRKESACSGHFTHGAAGRGSRFVVDSSGRECGADAVS